MAVEVRVGLGGEPGEVGVGDDEPVLGDAAGQVGVGGFPVEAVDADGDRQVPGAALGAVGGEGVAVADLSASGEVAVVQHDVDVGVAVEPHDEPSPVDGGDGAELPVGDVDEPAVEGAFAVAVASQRDAVTDVVAGAAVHGVAVVEHATFPQQVDGGPVEPVDDVVGPGQHHRSLTGIEGGGPAADGVADHRAGIGGDHDPAVVEVGADGVGARSRCAARRAPAAPTRLAAGG